MADRYSIPITYNDSDEGEQDNLKMQVMNPSTAQLNDHDYLQNMNNKNPQVSTSHNTNDSDICTEVFDENSKPRPEQVPQLNLSSMTEAVQPHQNHNIVHSKTDSNELEQKNTVDLGNNLPASELNLVKNNSETVRNMNDKSNPSEPTIQVQISPQSIEPSQNQPKEESLQNKLIIQEEVKNDLQRVPLTTTQNDNNITNQYQNTQIIGGIQHQSHHQQVVSGVDAYSLSQGMEPALGQTQDLFGSMRLQEQGQLFESVEILGPYWRQSNVMFMGYYQFTLTLKRSDLETFQVDRRYSEFDLLRQALEVQWPGLFIPCLPPKDAWISIQKEDSHTMKQRKTGIKNFLSAILAHELLGRDKLVSEFLEIRPAHTFQIYLEKCQKLIQERIFILKHKPAVQSKRGQSMAMQQQNDSKSFSGGEIPIEQTGGNSIFQYAAAIGSTISSVVSSAGGGLQLQGVELLEFNQEVDQMSGLATFLDTLTMIYDSVITEAQGLQITMGQLQSNYERMSANITQLMSTQQVNQEDFQEFNTSVIELRDTCRDTINHSLQDFLTQSLNYKQLAHGASEALQRRHALITEKYIIARSIKQTKNDQQMSGAKRDHKLQQLQGQQNNVKHMLVMCTKQIEQEVSGFKELKVKQTFESLKLFQTLCEGYAHRSDLSWQNCFKATNMEKKKLEFSGMTNFTSALSD